MSYLKNCIMHFRTILKHKKEVFLLCAASGIPWRGLVHDLSKFTPTEFFESAKYYQGNRSPITACKELNGYSEGWLHHRGHNKHHPEYWVDSLCLGGIPIKMPYVYNMEMICDIIAASKVYNGKNFHQNMPYDYWVNSMSKTSVLHEDTMLFTTIILGRYSIFGKTGLKKKYIKDIYEQIGRK